MDFFFELLKNRIGLSRIGRINLERERENVIKTPNIAIPLNPYLMENFNFIENFGCHEIFTISEEKYLKNQFLNDKFKNSGFIYQHKGTLEDFKRILGANHEIFVENDVIVFLPFNIPSTVINYEFAENEIHHYLTNVEKLLINNPQINFGLTLRCFNYFELTDYYFPFIKNHQNIKLLNFSDLFDNLYNFRNILETIVKFKAEIDNNKVFSISGKIISNYFPILIYLGFDLIDVTYFTYLASEGYYDSIDEVLPAYKIKYLPCNCLSCKGGLSKLLEKKYSGEKIDLLCYHNLITAKIYMNKVKQYLHTEDFRSFVEKSTLSNLNFIALLKILDKNHYNQIKNHSKLIQKDKIVKCMGPSSYYRPDFNYFREKVIKYFEPEYWTKLIIILPCSAKKPYSQSQSHKRFYEVIRKFPDFPNFQEIILTSPLGAIPRQLEDIYPVNCYDISVTGDWSAEEIEITSKMLASILEKYDDSIPIVCHLDGAYKEIIDEVENKSKKKFFLSEIIDHPTSDKSLKNLFELIKNQLDSYQPKRELPPKSDLTRTWVRKIVKIADYQYGIGFGMKLIKNGLKYKKNREHTKLTLFERGTKLKLGIFKFSPGKLRLSLYGTEKIAFNSDFRNYIIFDGEHLKGNTLFRPGIRDYPPNLLPDQNICIFDKEKKHVIAVGDMIVGSSFIKNSTSGRITKLYDTK